MSDSSTSQPSTSAKKTVTRVKSPVKAAAEPSKPAVKPPAVKKLVAAKKELKKAAAKPASNKSKPAKPAKPEAAKKPKLVRDSFTLPQADHDLIKQCKKNALAAGRETKKSEVLRAAIQSFAALSAAQQTAAYNKLQTIAVGRPKSK